ncbi:hypothetical protein BGZ54_007924 [Gamsiella multidivaricata]|nr:hypothetical protein BGZ54_007924 [Gamsiella multidivaricata]
MIVVPLAQLKLVEGIEEVHKYLDFTDETFIHLADNSIDHFQDLKDGARGELGSTAGQSDMNKLEALEGSDLRRLKSYLRAADKGCTLGSLCQIVTQEGYVKWACVDHYRENCCESVMQRLWNAVEANKGSFSEEIGKIKISLGSSTAAYSVYFITI